MEPLPQGEAAPPRPVPRPGAQPPAFDALGRPTSSPAAATVSAAAASTVTGTIAIRVQPGDAVILVDGEQWHSSSPDRLELQVAAGAHRIEVRKDGFQTFSTEMTVRIGETSALNVSLTRSQESAS